jgi:DNA mismatch endonuclease (patch repair protein)
MRRTGPRDEAVTSRIMASIRGKDGKAECRFRRALYARGIRYRKHYKRALGTPDVAIPWARVAVFIDGDFWHGNGWRLRGLPDLASLFPTRTEYWVAKITRNIERDKRYTAELERQGWTVLRFWESEVLQDVDHVVDHVVCVLEELRWG